MGTKVFTINPGSTSTKFALYEGNELIFSESVRHDAANNTNYPDSISQLDFRVRAIEESIEKNSINISEVDAFAGRGGLLRPLKGGTYKVNDEMLDDLSSAKYGDHASNLGAVIADSFSKQYNKPAYVVNPVVVDEFMDEARYTGVKDITRISIFHALNQKSVATRVAGEMGKKYEEVNFIVAHLGGGISIGAHLKGRVVDVTNGLYEGPFTPERAGALPTKDLVDICLSNKYTKKEIMKLLVGKGGLYNYTGTKDFQEILSMAEKDVEVKKLINAFIYNISKDICAMSTALKGDVDKIIITGGVAYNEVITKGIEEYVSFIAPVEISPGEDELRALAEGVLAVINGEQKALEY